MEAVSENTENVTLFWELFNVTVRTLVPWTQARFPRLFHIIRSEACFRTRLLHYLLFDAVGCNGRKIAGAHVAKITVPNYEIGTTFASVWNKGFPFKEIISFWKQRIWTLSSHLLVSYYSQKGVYWSLSSIISKQKIINSTHNLRQNYWILYEVQALLKNLREKLPSDVYLKPPQTPLA